MIRGTTPTLEFSLPFETSLLSTAYITMAQNDEVVLEKELTDCECNKCVLSVRLKQEETLKLQCDCKTEIQLRVKTIEDDSLASDIFVVDAERILKDGVI